MESQLYLPATQSYLDKHKEKQILFRLRLIAIVVSRP
jgi:hypothetical protein